MPILNLTQHPATPSQVEAGVFDMSEDDRREWARLCTFESLETCMEQTRRAVQFGVELATKYGASNAMIGGAMWMIAPLAQALADADVCVCFAFSKRRVVEKQAEDGTVVKTSVFEHQGFVPFMD